ncbi:LOW QUALITY PROTEIN: oocyte-secreted protein 3 [Sorex araneus]|uniref:LOW QUALITY PROTEIN: oocyte-secreted protein 3 n=1 Tax=Sorex araneus TaxID=42254 RepID=UPI0024335022|nr:LOW QUALITY PROTEIN: oocyte-secreted protein 3 [Sorex araneus]
MAIPVAKLHHLTTELCRKAKTVENFRNTEIWGLKTLGLLTIETGRFIPMVFYNTTKEQDSMSSRCSPLIFWAVAETALIDQDDFLHSDEVSLGIGCPVTDIIKEVSEFNYLKSTTICLFGFAYWIPHFQDPFLKIPHKSIELFLLHSLVHESVNMAVF